MTDQMDNRLKELVTKVAAAAPEAPPFPQKAEPGGAPGPRVPAWALSAAGAAAVLLVIGVPFLLFSGGTRDQDPATTLPPTSVPITPVPTTTPPDVTPGLISQCLPGGLRVQALESDNPAGHVVTPLEITNVSGDACLLEQPLSVTGIGTGGEEVPAVPGTYIPIAADAGSLVDADDSRTMLLETGTGCEGGLLIGPEAAEARITLGTGDLTVPFGGDLGCQFGYSDFGLWLDIDAPPMPEELAIIDLLVSTWAPGEPFPFAETVTLTLGPDIARTETAESLSDPAAWEFNQQDGFRGWVGPFSALDLLKDGRPIEVTAGPHDHCAAPPVPINEALVGLRHLSIQPTDATSCLEWWAVDLFLNNNLEIAGVTLDLWEP